jgi:hypothetical protein
MVLSNRKQGIPPVALANSKLSFDSPPASLGVESLVLNNLSGLFSPALDLHEVQRGRTPDGD